MGAIDINKIADIHRKIEAILLNAWDPIGVGSIPQCHDEYRGYVRGVYDVAVATRSARAVAEHLVEQELGHIGLSYSPGWKARLPVAESILALVVDVGPLP